MNKAYQELASCSLSGLLGSPPDKPMMRIPKNAKHIPNISNLERVSFNQQNASNAVVKIFELKTTKKTPRGTKLTLQVREQKPIDCAKLLIQTAFLSLRGMEEKKVYLKINLTKSPEASKLIRDWVNVISIGLTPCSTYKSLNITFERVWQTKTPFKRRKTFGKDMSFQSSFIAFMLRRLKLLI